MKGYIVKAAGYVRQSAVLKCINLRSVMKIQSSSTLPLTCRQNRYQHMFQFSAFHRFRQIIICKYFKGFFIKFLIVRYHDNRYIISPQSHCPYSLQAFPIFAVQSHEHHITDLMFLGKSVKKPLSAAIYQYLRIRNKCGQLPGKFLCIFSYFVTYRNCHYRHGSGFLRPVVSA